MRRLLVWIALAQALGIAAADRGWPPPEAALVLAAGAVCLGLVLPRRTHGAAALVSAFAAGAFALGQHLDDAQRRPTGGALELTLEGRVAEVTRSVASWTLRLDQVAGLDALAPPRVQLSGRTTPQGVIPFEAAVPGERVRARVRLHAPRPLRNPGAPDRERRARRAGLGAVGGLAHASLHARLPGHATAGLPIVVQRWRARVSRRLGASPGAALLRALALGDRADLPDAARDACARLGIAHLLAVSGLHLAWVAALAYAALRLGPARSAWLAARTDARRLALVGSLGAAAAYALAAGWGIPVRRALLLLGALCLASLAGRGRVRLEPLALAALLILAGEPGALFAAGAQLSFVATAALLFAARAASPAGRVAELLRTSATALAATAPLAALHLGTRAPLALPANLVAVPWTGLVLLPAAFTALAAASFRGAPGAGVLLSAASGLAERSLAWTERAAALAPGAGISAPPDPRWVAATAALGLAALCARSIPVRVGWSALLLLVLALAPPAPVLPRAPRAVFLDVGQGDAVLVQGGRAALLLDAGVALEGGPDLGRVAVLPALRALGVTRLDLVAASHADLDHRGGLPAVLAALPVGALWLPRGGLGEPDFAPLVGAARARGVPVAERGLGDAPLQVGDLHVVPLWPRERASELSRNDRSLVLLVEVAGRRVLLPGDLEAAGEAGLVASGARLRADVLKLPHHGSRSSSGGALLAAVGPGVAVVSAPCEGRFGMPHAEVVSRVRAAGASLWWTGRDGAVLVGLAAGPAGVLHVAGHAAPRRCRPGEPGRYHGSP